MKLYLTATALSLLLIALSACSGTPESQTPDTDTPTPTYPAASRQAVPKAGVASNPAASPTPTLTSITITPMPVPAATPTFASEEKPPTPEKMWIRDRVSAIVSLYDISPAGREWLESYDLRQMVGRPGWFGSLGYESWAGVGQAIPHSILHEISHSYYGAFPVSGYAHLTWKRQSGQAISPAMKQYHQDLIAFMLQPPDRYEPLRDRFRNLPNLSREEDPDLFHFGEADLLYTAGGGLNLIPPILRKYFDQFLAVGGFQTWDEAIAWYLGLSPEDKRAAETYIGIPHLPLRHYSSLTPSKATQLPESIKALLEKEERQRLIDFAEQYDLIKSNEFSFVDAANVDRSFQFWRDYIRDMLRLHRNDPQLLAAAPGRGPQLKNALDTFLEAEKLSQDQQIEFFRDRLKDPFLMDFSVLLPSRVLIELFSRSPDKQILQSVEGVIGRFSQKLAKYAREVDDVLSTGRKDLQKGSDKLEKLLQGLTDDQQEKDLTLIFELMRDADRITSKNLLNRLSDEAILRMLKNKPSVVRSDAVFPERLLQALKITPQHSPTEISQGLKTLLKETSGNFQIDEPFTFQAYRVVADVGTRDFQTGLAILREAKVPLLDFVEVAPRVSVKILSSNLSEAARLIANPQGYARSPQGIVHGLINVDPILAARIVLEMEKQGMGDIATESLIVFAYDAARLRAIPDLPISLEKDGRFLKVLLEEKGAVWLEGRMAEGVGLYRQRVERNEVPDDFIAAYERTLRAVASGLEDEKMARTLEDILDRVFQDVMG